MRHSKCSRGPARPPSTPIAVSFGHSFWNLPSPSFKCNTVRSGKRTLQQMRFLSSAVHPVNATWIARAKTSLGRPSQRENHCDPFPRARKRIGEGETDLIPRWYRPRGSKPLTPVRLLRVRPACAPRCAPEPAFLPLKTRNIRQTVVLLNPVWALGIQPVSTGVLWVSSRTLALLRPLELVSRHWTTTTSTHSRYSSRLGSFQK